MKLTITLSDAEYKALSVACFDPQEWIQNCASERARIAMKEIFDKEIERITNDPKISEIPADIEQVVMSAKIKTAKEQEESDKEMLEQE